jgi:hypothetical protein
LALKFPELLVHLIQLPLRLFELGLRLRHRVRQFLNLLGEILLIGCLRGKLIGCLGGK